MGVRGRVDIGGEALLPEYRAFKIGPWALVTFHEDEFEASVATDVPASDPFGLRIPGFWILDARNKWKFSESKKSVVVFKHAFLIKENDELPHVGGSRRVCLALVGAGPIQARKPSGSVAKYGSASARLEIGQIAKELVIQGEVFIQPTARGYAPAILVKTKDGLIHHCLVGAKSFSDPLEVFRATYGKLTGLTIRVRKISEGKYALYQVELVGG